MLRVIISTIGTSLLTNQINRSADGEKSWYNQLRDTANLKADSTPKEVLAIIEELKNRAIGKLTQSQIHQIRLASAELNGIYGIYQEKLLDGKQDIHYLISTDTLQGRATAEIVDRFLKKNGLVNVSIYTPTGLSTASNQAFSEGIDDIIVWLRKEIIPLRDKYKICFNLVGSFKSLQGYLNTIGMFYADEIIYIFEGKDSNLITIPRLPIKVDESLIEPHTTQLTLINAGYKLPSDKTVGIPETLIGDFNGQKVLSTWGQLIWDESKINLLSRSLLDFPCLQYTDTFRSDYNKIRDKQEKVQLHEDLAKVSSLLTDSQGDTSILKQHPGFQYDKYSNRKDDIGHFRVTQGLRISCVSTNGTLTLRRYGKEPDVNKNP